MVRAVTFDLWDTLVADDSDEAVRSARGLPSKADARRLAFEAYATARGVSAEAAAGALEAANGRFRHQWKVLHRTPHIGDRLLDGLGEIGLTADDGFEALVETFAQMEVRIPPKLAPGAREVLEALHSEYRLGIVSDAIVTPGAQLRELLAGYDLLRFFDVTVFSDEAGASKPDPKVFHLAAAGLGVEVTEIVHIGDRPANDIAGPRAAGAKGLLYTGVVDRGPSPEADGTYTDHGDLAKVLASLGA